MNKTILKYASRIGAVAICSAALVAVPMLAQGGGGYQPPSSEQRVARIDQAVGPLTDDQKTKIKAIYDADQKKMDDLRQSQDPDMRTKMMAMRTDENKQIRALLTPDQQTKFDAMPQGRGRMGGGGGMGGGGNGAPPPPAQ